VGGKFHPKLNIDGRPIANKYREGKMQRTLKRELKVLEIAEGEAVGGSVCGSLIQVAERLALGVVVDARYAVRSPLSRWSRPLHFRCCLSSASVRWE